MDFLIVAGVAMVVISLLYIFYTKWKEKAELVDILEDEITRRQKDTKLFLKLQERLEAVSKWHEDIEIDPDDRFRLEEILEAGA